MSIKFNRGKTLSLLRKARKGRILLGANVVVLLAIVYYWIVPAFSGVGTAIRIAQEFKMETYARGRPITIFASTDGDDLHRFAITMDGIPLLFLVDDVDKDTKSVQLRIGKKQSIGANFTLSPEAGKLLGNTLYIDKGSKVFYNVQRELSTALFTTEEACEVK